MTDFETGLMISVVGLLVTFAALGIFIGVIVLLQKLFPFKPEVEKVETEEADETATLVAEAETDVDEITAVLAAAAYLRTQQSGQLGAELLGGPGPYRRTR